jgi:chorismate dehydratase
MSPLRFGCHDFLNALPLLQNLEKRRSALNLAIQTGTPGELADRLQAGELDLAMIPSYEYLKNATTYRLLPGVCIASRGEVESVFLVTKNKNLKQIKTVAVDCRSRTSVAVLKILFGDRFDSDWNLRPTAPDLEAMLSENSAALIIGDPALELDRSRPYIRYDLSQEWFRRTGKSFVHAVVAIREGVVISKEILNSIQNATQKDAGLLEIICRKYADEDEAKFVQCQNYLTHKISYNLGSEEIEGLTQFQKMCENIDEGMSPHDFIWENVE